MLTEIKSQNYLLTLEDTTGIYQNIKREMKQKVNFRTLEFANNSEKINFRTLEFANNSEKIVVIMFKQQHIWISISYF